MTRKIVGFDRKLEREWLDYAAARAVERLPIDAMRKRLWDFLDGRVAAGGSRWNSDRGKAITVLMRIWGPGAGRYEALRGRSLDALDGAQARSRLAVHWALCLGSYPFFADVARIVGQHLSLHGEVLLAEVRRRLVEAWGDRAVTRNAAQRILRSMIDWGVLEDGPRRGAYLGVPGPTAAGPSIARLLVEGLLLSNEGAPVPASLLRSNPVFFPFSVDATVLGLGSSEAAIRLEREGPDSEYLRLA
jgi:hypothetical protein